MKKRETREERIRRYEFMLNEVKAVHLELEQAVADYQAVRPKIRELERYYTSASWKRDFTASEKGELPEGLLCGVLSEDGINDVLDDDLELRKKISEMF